MRTLETDLALESDTAPPRSLHSSSSFVLRLVVVVVVVVVVMSSSSPYKRTRRAMMMFFTKQMCLCISSRFFFFGKSQAVTPFKRRFLTTTRIKHTNKKALRFFFLSLSLSSSHLSLMNCFFVVDFFFSFLFRLFRFGKKKRKKKKLNVLMSLLWDLTNTN